MWASTLPTSTTVLWISTDHELNCWVLHLCLLWVFYNCSNPFHIILIKSLLDILTFNNKSKLLSGLKWKTLIHTTNVNGQQSILQWITHVYSFLQKWGFINDVTDTSCCCSVQDPSLAIWESTDHQFLQHLGTWFCLAILVLQELDKAEIIESCDADDY